MDASEEKWRKWIETDLPKVANELTFGNEANAKVTYAAAAKLGEWHRTMPNDVEFLTQKAPAMIAGLFASKAPTSQLIKNFCDALDAFAVNLDSKKPFLGGDQPNLADTELYGFLSNYEFNPLFAQVLAASKIAAWFARVKSFVNQL